MFNITYNPEDVGKKVINNHGRISKVRKYHMTDKEQKLIRNKWLEEIKDVDKKIIMMAGKYFFNPYRKGIYYYQIYSLFLLGSNQWHSLNSIIKKIEEIMSEISVCKDEISMTSWERFRGKSSRSCATKCKDFIGRIQENMIFFQRLNKLHPTGYKLMQVRSAVDMKRVNKKGFSSGVSFYRLSTYKDVNQALPIRDYKDFEFPQHEKKYVNYKFIGTIITKNKIIIKGKINEMSSMQSRKHKDCHGR